LCWSIEEPSIGAPGQVIEDGELFTGADRIPRGQDQAERGELDPARPRGQVGVQQQRRHRRLIPLGVDVMLGGRKDVEPGLGGQGDELSHLLEHLSRASGMSRRSFGL
jgi:hypothetical protein